MRNYIIALFLFILFAKCATQSSPGGGPQDKRPPKLLSSKPKDNELNFKGETIELTFDEYIKLKDPSEEIVITPSVGKETKFIAKKNKVIIIPKNKLLENTTYSISFRDGVQDINESNPAYNLRLAFSTGPVIDSLKISGSISEMFKEEIPEKITVAIYQADTFNIFNHAATYFAKTDKKGKFTINNLKAGNYYIYAFDDKSKNLKIESKSERFGFLNKRIELTDDYDSLQIPLIKVDSRPIKITSIRHTQNISKIRFTKPVDLTQIRTQFSKYYTVTYGDKQDELIFYGILNEQPKEDSLKIDLSVRDSVGNTLDTITYLKSVKVKVPAEKFKTSFTQPKYNIETQKLLIKGNFNKPIKQINIDSLYIQIDSTTFQAIDKKEIKIDTLNHTLIIETVLKIKKPEKEIEGSETKAKPVRTEEPLLVIGKSAFLSIENDSSAATNSRIKILKEEELGALAIDVQTNEKSYIVELVTRNGEVERKLENPKKYVFKNLPPEEYKIRILVDANDNKKWDAGNFEKKIEPEKIILFKTFDGKSSTPVRANWEVGPLVIKF
jgi:uncharacterized protein (DUF2141 family)